MFHHNKPVDSKGIPGHTRKEAGAIRQYTPHVKLAEQCELSSAEKTLPPSPLRAADETSSLGLHTHKHTHICTHTHRCAHAHIRTHAAPNSTPHAHIDSLHSDPQLPASSPMLPTTMLSWFPHNGVFLVPVRLSVCCSHVWWGALCRGWSGAVSKLARALCRRRRLCVEDSRGGGEADLLGHSVVSV